MIVFDDWIYQASCDKKIFTASTGCVLMAATCKVYK